MELRDFLSQNYSSYTDVSLKENLLDVCVSFINRNAGDANAELRLRSENNNVYWQQLSEILIEYQLNKAGIKTNHPKIGPDFVIENDSRRVFIEVITPEAQGLPYYWTNHKPGTAVSVPHEEILLRWTAAIKEKSETLLGNDAKNRIGYIEKRVVHPDDIYVIAVNSRLLRGFGGAFPELIGISQFPFAVEATLGVGPIQAVIDRKTLELKSVEHQNRYLIPKNNTPGVPGDVFLDQKFKSISAIWAMDIDEGIVVGRNSEIIVVHNPMAHNPLQTKFLPAYTEFRAIDHGDYFTLEKTDGTLKQTGLDNLTSVEIFR